MRVEKFSVGRFAWNVVELIDTYISGEQLPIRTALSGVFQILRGLDPLIGNKLNSNIYKVLNEQIDKGEQSLEKFASDLAEMLEPELPHQLKPLFRSILFNLKTLGEWTSQLDEKIYSILLYALEHLDEPEKSTAA